MKPRLIPNAAKVARRAWSFRLAVLSAILGAVQVGMSLLTPERPSFAFALASSAVAAGAALARLIQQNLEAPHE